MTEDAEGLGRGPVSRAPQPSYVTLPRDPPSACRTIFEFLVQRFAQIPMDTWKQRVQEGEVLEASGERVTLDTPYRVGLRVSYYRSVQVAQASPSIPILYEDDEILVADKPHGISVTPSGNEVGGCLLYLLWDRSPDRTLTPVHRIDRDTAGLVLFVKRAEDRGLWQQCFARGEVEKLYFASAVVQLPLETHYWCVRSRISATELPLADGRPSVRRVSRTSKRPNSCSEIYFAGPEVSAEEGGAVAVGRFWIRPRTGKQHQIRLHLASLGFPILGDRIYGRRFGGSQGRTEDGSMPQSDDPLQLHSAELVLDHPLTGQRLRFQSRRALVHWKTAFECQRETGA